MVNALIKVVADVQIELRFLGLHSYQYQRKILVLMREE
jgi:hypothetical protein